MDRVPRLKRKKRNASWLGKDERAQRRKGKEPKGGVGVMGKIRLPTWDRPGGAA